VLVDRAAEGSGVGTENSSDGVDGTAGTIGVVMSTDDGNVASRVSGGPAYWTCGMTKIGGVDVNALPAIEGAEP
jgi:hypothetical protein